jgi:hypothetical protein
MDERTNVPLDKSNRQWRNADREALEKAAFEGQSGMIDSSLFCLMLPALGI